MENESTATKMKPFCSKNKNNKYKMMIYANKEPSKKKKTNKIQHGLEQEF